MLFGRIYDSHVVSILNRFLETPFKPAKPFRMQAPPVPAANDTLYRLTIRAVHAVRNLVVRSGGAIPSDHSHDCGFVSAFLEQVMEHSLMPRLGSPLQRSCRSAMLRDYFPDNDPCLLSRALPQRHGRHPA
jgi:hypothetical protein